MRIPFYNTSSINTLSTGSHNIALVARRAVQLEVEKKALQEAAGTNVILKMYMVERWLQIIIWLAPWTLHVTIGPQVVS